MSEKRATYHHGDLRAALIQAADEIIAGGGIESFSLRAAAQRAGVSPGAPAHHFGSAKGLLTEVGLIAYERLGEYMAKVEHTDNPAANARALSLAFITFAVNHPGHFRLMFRTDLINRDDPRYPQTSVKLARRLSQSLAEYRGAPAPDLTPEQSATETFAALATLHGVAHLVLEGKAIHFFDAKDTADFMANVLPGVLERMYP